MSDTVERAIRNAAVVEASIRAAERDHVQAVSAVFRRLNEVARSLARMRVELSSTFPHWTDEQQAEYKRLLSEQGRLSRLYHASK